MQRPPLPDFSDIDFTFRPQIMPVAEKDIDDDDPSTKQQEVASCFLGYTMYGDSSIVTVDAQGPEYVYSLWLDEYVGDEEFREGSVTCTEPMTLGELLGFLESGIDTDYPLSVKCYYSFVTDPAAEDADDPESLTARELALTGDYADVIDAVTFESDVYPGFAPFYTRLNAYLKETSELNGRMPSVVEWAEMVGDVFERWVG